MASHIDTTPDAPIAENSRVARLQRRHTIAAIVYFLYGLFYLFGAQYVTSMGMSERGTSANASMFFVIGGMIAIVFPLLIYHMFALGFSLSWHKCVRRSTLYLSFTLILGLLVAARVYSLVKLGIYTQSSLHLTGLVIAALNALCLLWTGLSRPFWIHRHSEGAN